MAYAQTYVVDNAKASALSAGGGWHFEIVTDDADIAAATSGDLIIYGELVGFALTDYDPTTGSIVIDAGSAGYECAVVAEDSDGEGEDIYVGSWLYWDAAAGEVNRDDLHGVPIGQALEEVAAGETATIGITLRPCPPG